MPSPEDFGLSDPVPLPPEILRSDDRELDAFVLSLALAFNDLKVVEWVNLQMSRHRRPEAGVDPVQGQISGFSVWGARTSLGLIHEVMRAIEVAEGNGLLQRPIILETVNVLGSEDGADWLALVDVATAREVKGAPAVELRAYLTQLRNNVAFHYYQPKALLRGYDRFFFQDARSEFNQRAYVSTGPTMEETRFYFADAAAASCYENAANVHLFRNADKLRPLVAGALMAFLNGYLALRATLLSDE